MAPPYFLQFDNKFYAGVHMLIDLWSNQEFSKDVVEQFISEIAEISNVTILNLNVHEFNANNGLSVVALLSQSHISFHSWPEHKYAAIDIFLCGHYAPESLKGIIVNWFSPYKLIVSEERRGLIDSVDQGV